MVLAAAWLAELAPTDHQSRVLARYVFLWADAASLWLSRWRNEVKRDAANRQRARTAEPAVAALRDLVEHHSAVRDYLAAKRQALHPARFLDLERTLLLYGSINADSVRWLAAAAVEAYDTLAATAGSIGDVFIVDAQLPERLAAAVDIDPSEQVFAADTYAGAGAHTFQVAQGGAIGRRVGEVNDLASHLDVVLRLVPVVRGQLAFDWLVRSALLVELSALLDLTVGPPPEAKPNWGHRPLLDICRAGRAEIGAERLAGLRGRIGEEGWGYLRYARNKVGAHVDDQLSLFEVHRHLIELDLYGVVRLAESVLDELDWIGCYELDLKLLLFRARLRGDAARFDQHPIAPAFARLDSPYMIISGGGSLSSAAVAGMVAGRRPRPRDPVEAPPRPDPLAPPVRNLNVPAVLARAHRRMAS